MRPDARLGGRVHGVAVQGLGHEPGAPALERQRRTAVDDAVEVAAPHGGKPRMEVRRRGLGGQHGDGRRAQVGVERIGELVGPHLALQIEVHDLPEGVHTGVGAPGGVAGHGLAAEAVDRLFEGLLHARPVVLTLPADEGAAVVFQHQLEAGHDSGPDGRTAPAARRAPRKKAVPSTGALPGFWTSTRRSAPSPQAMVMVSSNSWPG